MADSVHIKETKLVTLPEQAIYEDRGVKACSEPMPILASVTDTSYYMNDRTAVDGKYDSIEVYLEDKNGNEELAPGIQVNYPHQSDAVGFIVDWRQYTHVVSGQTVVKSGCYKMKVYYDIQGITGSFYNGSYRLLPYTPRNAEGTTRLFVVLNDFVRTNGINYRDSGFATTIRFGGKFGYRQPNYEVENITEINRISYKVRNESINTFELRSNPLYSCYTDKIDTNHLLAASQIYISDHNAYNHKQYFDLAVILDEERSPELNYDGGGLKASISAYFKEKVKKRESKYNGDIQGSNNAILELPKGVVGGGGNCEDATLNIDNHTWSIGSGDTLDLEIIDDNGFPVPSTQSGNDIIIDMPPCVKDWLVMPYETGDISAATLDEARVTGTVQSINTAMVTGLVIKKNGVVVTAPFTIVDTDQITAEFDAAVADGAIVLDMTGTFSFPTLPQRNTALPMPTGQFTSYATGDDGDGSSFSDFYTLDQTNIWGHSFRFCGTTGGYTDGLSYFDVTGVATTKILAFPNSIYCDMSTFNGFDDTFLMYVYLSADIDTWLVKLAEANAFSLAGFSDWKMVNRNEANNIMNSSTPQALNYLPFDLAGAVFIWTRTTYPDDTSLAYIIRPNNLLGTTDKTNYASLMLCRITNITEL